jgi:hypothetical protein
MLLSFFSGAHPRPTSMQMHYFIQNQDAARLTI